MRAIKIKQAGWIALGALVILNHTMADPALPPPVGQNVYNPPGSIKAAPADPDLTFDNIDVDAGLKGKLAILRVGSEPSANNLLSVFAGLKNKTARSLNLQVQTIYKDSEGNPLNAGSWITLTLKAHEEREYRSTSISELFDPNAVEAPFLIRVRRAPYASATHP